jgi:hypothetical protein
VEIVPANDDDLQMILVDYRSKKLTTMLTENIKPPSDSIRYSLSLYIDENKAKLLQTNRYG